MGRATTKTKIAINKAISRAQEVVAAPASASASASASAAAAVAADEPILICIPETAAG